jgi:hypothetical protein
MGDIVEFYRDLYAARYGEPCTLDDAEIMEIIDLVEEGGDMSGEVLREMRSLGT